MKITITGEITDFKSSGCYCPQDLKDVLSTLDENEPLEVEITSEGGSVIAGIQISNLLARWKGNVTTHGVGLVASIATVVLMAGKKVAVDENCFCMIHRPWTFTQGNADDLEKEIGNLEKCEAAMMGFYRKHSKVSDDELLKMLSDETWFLGTEFADVFDIEVIPNDEQLNIAAKFDLSKFHKLPEVLNMKNKIEQAVAEQTDDEEKKVEETVEEETTVEEPEQKEEVVEEEVEEKTEETTDDEPEKKEEKEKEEVLNKEEVEEKFKEYENTIEELKKRCAELEEELEQYKKPDENEEESVSKAECEKRVSGMQASMQKQVNDFKNQLKLKEEELVSVKEEIISLNAKLDKSVKELSDMTSALEEKTMALAKLNAGVNAPCDYSVDWRSLKGEKFFDYVKKHPELVK